MRFEHTLSLSTLRRFCAIVLAGVTAACEDQICTLVGCANNLRIELVGAVPDRLLVRAVVVEGLFAGGPHEVSRTCSAEEPCWSPSQTPHVNLEIVGDVVAIEISWDGGAAQDTVRPQWSSFQPNGPKCEPTCWGASTTFTL